MLTGPFADQRHAALYVNCGNLGAGVTGLRAPVYVRSGRSTGSTRGQATFRGDVVEGERSSGYQKQTCKTVVQRV